MLLSASVRRKCRTQTRTTAPRPARSGSSGGTSTGSTTTIPTGENNLGTPCNASGVHDTNQSGRVGREPCTRRTGLRCCGGHSSRRAGERRPAAVCVKPQKSRQSVGHGAGLSVDRLSEVIAQPISVVTHRLRVAEEKGLSRRTHPKVLDWGSTIPSL